MTIPHVQERLKLAGLDKQLLEILTEEHDAVEETVTALGSRSAGPELQAVYRAFRPRIDAIREAIAAAEAAIGDKLSANPWSGDGGTAYCALTGLPILKSDLVGVVLIDALPVSAAGRQNEAA